MILSQVPADRVAFPDLAMLTATYHYAMCTYRVYPIRSTRLIEARASPIFNRYVPVTKSLKLLYFTFKYVAFCTDLLQ